MKIFILERIGDFDAADAIINDVNIILKKIKKSPQIAKKTEKLILIPINMGQIKLEIFNYPFYIAIKNTNGIPGASFDKDFNVIIFIKNTSIHDIYKNIYNILNKYKADIYHELNHIIDFYKSKGKIFNKYTSAKEDKHAYINTEAEFNTMLREAFFFILEKTQREYNDIKQLYNDSNYKGVFENDSDILDEFSYLSDSRNFIKGLVKKIENLRLASSPTNYKLNPEQLKRIRKRGYTMYDKMKERFLKKIRNENIP